MEEETAYQHALDYLYSFIDYSLTRSFQFSPEKFNLDRMRALLERLGRPERAAPLIHVAGTKGKGSTAALIASALTASGQRVGLYTSPHLSDYAERIQVDGRNIPHGELAVLVNELKPHVAAVPELTTFELTTALAFMHFQRSGVSASVIEVGLGGRLDATNVVEPLLSVITSLSLDHMNLLGDTLPKIAAEKAGIIKPGRPVVFAPQKEEALRVLEATAAELGARTVLIGRDFYYAPVEHSLDGQSLMIWPASQQTLADHWIENGGWVEGWEPAQLKIPLLGYHQVVNAAVAYAALQTARQEGLAVPEEAIQRGFASVSWPGRFEILSRTPLLIADSAHNPDSALKLRLALDDYLPGQGVVLVYGASEDKDVRGMFAELLPRVRQLIATQSIHPRALEAEKIVAIAHQFGCPARAVIPLEEALRAAIQKAGRDAAVVVTGSLFVAAAARDAWRELQNEIVREEENL